MSIPGLDPIPIGEQGPASEDSIKLLTFDDKEFIVPEAHRFGRCRPVTEFEKIDHLGEGAYGVVYKARDKRKDEIVALKRLKVSKESEGIPLGCIREISILKQLKHENIVNLEDIVVGRNLEQIYVVMEFCEYDLSNVIDDWALDEKLFRPPEIKCIMQQLFSGLGYLHKNFVIHRDIKVSNILFTDRGCLKIADFGLSRKICLEEMTPEVASMWYRAPELLFAAKRYTSAVDVWSAGCIFAELLLNKPLFPGKSDCEMITMIIICLGTPNEIIWPGCSKFSLMQSYDLGHHPYNNLKSYFEKETAKCVALLHQLFLYNPEKRLSAQGCLSDAYFFEEPSSCTLDALAARMKDSKKLIP